MWRVRAIAWRRNFTDPGTAGAGFLAPVVGMMVDHLGWLATLASGSVFALVGAGLWLLVRIEPGSGRRDVKEGA